MIEIRFQVPLDGKILTKQRVSPYPPSIIKRLSSRVHVTAGLFFVLHVFLGAITNIDRSHSWYPQDKTLTTLSSQFDSFFNPIVQFTRCRGCRIKVDRYLKPSNGTAFCFLSNPVHGLMCTRDWNTKGVNESINERTIMRPQGHTGIEGTARLNVVVFDNIELIVTVSFDEYTIHVTSLQIYLRYLVDELLADFHRSNI